MVLDDDPKIIHTLLEDQAFRRGLSPTGYLQENPGVVKVFREVLLHNFMEGIWESDGIPLRLVDSDINTCYRDGCKLNPSQSQRTTQINPVYRKLCSSLLLFFIGGKFLNCPLLFLA